MRLNRTFLALVALCGLVTAAAAQDVHDWQSLAKLRTGDDLRLSLRTGPATGAFQTWTPQQMTAGTVTARREDVLKIERYRLGRRERGQRAALGAIIGFGGGFALGAAGGGCCFTHRAYAGAFGVTFAMIGGGIGALIPRRAHELIYATK